MSEQLGAFLEMVRCELGVLPSLQPPTQAPESLPAPLADFYSVTDGLELPFIEIFPAAKIHDDGVPGWLLFGADPYGSFCLCRKAPPWDLGLWQHDSGTSPEGGFAQVLELLQLSYEDSWRGSSGRACRLVLSELPRSVSLATVVAELKVLCGASSAELLTRLKTLPLTVECENREGVVNALRHLQAKGVQGHWEAG